MFLETTTQPTTVFSLNSPYFILLDSWLIELLVLIYQKTKQQQKKLEDYNELFDQIKDNQNKLIACLDS